MWVLNEMEKDKGGVKKIDRLGAGGMSSHVVRCLHLNSFNYCFVNGVDVLFSQ